MFLQDVPISAYLVCYGPLVITVLGFIVFAALTDGNARRTYLRRKLGEQRLGDLVNVRTRPLTVETPAGSQLTIQPTTPRLGPPDSGLLPEGGPPDISVQLEVPTATENVEVRRSSGDSGGSISATGTMQNETQQ